MYKKNSTKRAYQTGFKYSLCALAIVQATQSFAQEPNDQDAEDEDLEVVTIHGVKLRSTVQELDVSVEVLDEERLDRERIIELSDVFLKTPNVTSDGISSGRISIRGISRSGTGRGATSNIYIDGSPLSELAIGNPNNLWDMEQVEVLRGSQSTVQGRNAMAGAVVIKTADPTFEREGKFRLTQARFNATQASAALGGGLIDEELAGRIAIDYRSEESFIENINPDFGDNDTDALTIRTKLLFQPSSLPDFESKLTVEYNDTDTNMVEFVRSDVPVTDPTYFDFDFFNYNIDFSLGDRKLETTRAISETRYALDENWTIVGMLTFEEALGDQNLVNGPSNSIISQRDEQTYTAELRLEFEFETIRGLMGGYFFDLEEEFSNNMIAPIDAELPLAIRPLVTFDPADSTTVTTINRVRETENYAIFAELEWDITNHIILKAGFRYDEEEFNDPNQLVQINTAPDNCMATFPGAIVGAPTQVLTLPCQTFADQLTGLTTPLAPAPNLSFSAFLPRLGLTYKFDDDHSVSLSYQRGYRAGGATIALVDNPNGEGQVRDNLAFDPEFLDSIEFSSRNLFLDKKLVANANIFYSKYEDQQISITGDDLLSPFNSRIENAAETTLYGAEFLLDYTPTDNWNVYASVGLLETDIDDFQFATQGEFQNLSGNELPNAPNLTYTLGASYTADSGFYASATYSFIDEQFSEPDNLSSDNFRQAFANAGLNPEDGARLTEVIESRADLTMQIGYKFHQFAVYVFGSNLLNDETLTWVDLARVDTASGAIAFRNRPAGVPNRPRIFGVGIDYNF